MCSTTTIGVQNVKKWSTGFVILFLDKKTALIPQKYAYHIDSITMWYNDIENMPHLVLII